MSAGPSAPQPLDSNSAVAIVTTFHPTPGLGDRLAPVLREVKRLLIVDNGSATAEQREIRALVDRDEADAVWNDTNLGLATALDQGLEWAAGQNAVWALLVDQDTGVQPGIVAEAQRVLRLAGPAAVAALGAGVIGKDGSGATDGEGWREERFVITAGTFVSVEAWRKLGGFRRDFFVDYVDIEFCLRARAAGYRILRSLNPTMQHAIGRPRRRRLAWRTVTPTFHDRSRRYWITRNRIVVWRMYGRLEPGFVIADAWAFLKELVKIVILEDDRFAKTKAIAAGIRDGMHA